MFYCNNTIWPHPTFKASDTQVSTHLSHLCVSLSTFCPIRTSEPVSLLYCQNINLKSAIEKMSDRISWVHGFLTCLSDQSIVRCLFYIIFFLHYIFYCSIAMLKKKLNKITQMKNKIHSCTFVSLLPTRSFLMHILNDWVTHNFESFALGWQWDMIIRRPTTQRVHRLAIPKIIFTSM